MCEGKYELQRKLLYKTFLEKLIIPNCFAEQILVYVSW